MASMMKNVKKYLKYRSVPVLICYKGKQEVVSKFTRMLENKLGKYVGG
jgi:hypothetical protein